MSSTLQWTAQDLCSTRRLSVSLFTPRRVATVCDPASTLTHLSALSVFASLSQIGSASLTIWLCLSPFALCRWAHIASKQFKVTELQGNMHCVLCFCKNASRVAAFWFLSQQSDYPTQQRCQIKVEHLIYFHCVGTKEVNPRVAASVGRPTDCRKYITCCKWPQ